MAVSLLLSIVSALAAPPAEGVELPLEGPQAGTPEGAGPELPPDGAAPLASAELEARARDEPAPVIVRPLGDTVMPTVAPLDPKTTRIVRMDFTAGPMWRVREIDPAVMTSIEVGAMRGFSASFHAGMIIGANTDHQTFFRSDPVRASDYPIGFGALARGRLGKRPLYASIGLTAGILVHRARVPRTAEEDGNQTLRQVDPDFRVPIRFAWTIASVGISLALEQGYSVRAHSYQLRGSEVWARSAYRIGFTIGLHCDVMAGRTIWNRSGRRSRSRR